FETREEKRCGENVVAMHSGPLIALWRHHARHVHGWMWCLYRAWCDAVRVIPKKATMVGKYFLRPGLENDLQAFVEAWPDLGHIDARHLIIIFVQAPTHAEVQAPAAQHVYHAVVLCQLHRVVQGQE